jgi:hypothetical protein
LPGCDFEIKSRVCQRDRRTRDPACNPVTPRGSRSGTNDAWARLLELTFVRGKSVRDTTKTTITSIYTAVKATGIGVLLSEAWYFGRALGPGIATAAAQSHLHDWELSLGILAVYLLVAFLSSQNFFQSVHRLLKSGRLDVFFAFGFGVLIPIVLGGIWSQRYQKWAATDIAPIQLGIAVLAPVAIVLAFFFGQLIGWLRCREPGTDAFFINDVALDEASKDLLEIAEKANRFADRVLNNYSSMNMVFGIDAPWGIGKSTFINFCKDRWTRTQRDRVIVYDFNPLRYEGSANLAETFVDGLIRAIQSETFIPELRSLVSRYSRFLRGAKAKFSLLDLELPSSGYTIDDAHEYLEAALSQLGKKVIVIVDDLDRLTLPAAKEVLYTIKKSFALPNVSYVLAYDTENIGALEERRPDADKLTEFLEKFINVKISIFLESTALAKYVSEYLSEVLSGNSEADPILVSTAVGGLVEILRSSDYFKYQPLIGDIRKIKRLINTLLLLEIERVDFKNSDFNKEDLIRLLLIYINYPSMFRKIYDSETEGRMGAFSVLGQSDIGYPPETPQERQTARDERMFKNSEWYEEYRKSLRDSQQLLVDGVFRVSGRLPRGASERVDEITKRSYACFNGGGGSGRNLEQYLHLIVRLSKPQSETQYRFYLNAKNEIARDTPIEEVLSKNKEFAWSMTERNRQELWRVIVNSTRDFDARVGKRLIRHLVDHIHEYCLLEDGELGVGLRHDLPLYLLQLLDAVGWQDEGGLPRNNSNENIQEIAEWILGERRYQDVGVVDTLAKEDKGVLGFYDLMVFRLYCSADRSGNTFNVQRALATHGDPSAPTDGPVRAIAIAGMREVSQRIYRVFETLCVRKRINILEVIDRLSLADLCGMYRVFVDAARAEGKLEDADTRVDALRSRLKAFIVYQLANARVEMGVGCGYYDVDGKADKHGISDLMNEYLFEVCFNPVESARNYERFVDYLLINFTSTFGSGRRAYVPTAEEFTKVLQRNRLAAYWKTHSSAIKGLRFTERDKVVATGNYKLSYKEDLESAYAVLDRLASGPESPGAMAG